MGHKLVRLDGVVVAVGSFNPAIVTPDWLVRRGLISDSEGEECLSKMQALVQEGLMAFDATWFSLRLVQNQFILSTTSGVTPRLRDLAVGIFSLLPETPLTAIGLNFVADLQFDSEDEYHRFGHFLAPKKVWNDLYPTFNAGLATLTIALDNSKREGVLDAMPKSEQRRFTMQPSNTVSPHAVHIAFNHHYPIDEKNGARDGLQIISSQWDLDQDEAEKAFDQLGQIVNQQGG